MTATNHALTGAIIGLSIANPVIAMPAALLSHFVLDSIPHYGSEDSDKAIKTKAFRDYLIIEALLCFTLVVIIATRQPYHWQYGCLGAFLGASPDFLWIRRFITVRRGKNWISKGFDKFAADIQWFAKPIGAVVEIAWLIGAIIILIPILGLAKY